MKLQHLFDWTRHTLNKHSPAVTLVALIILSITAIDIVQQLRKPKFNAGDVDTYYYDLVTDGLFVGKSSALPPIAGPGSTGPADLTAVRAIVFACHDCNDTRDRYVGWVEGFSGEARASLTHALSGEHGPVPFGGPPPFGAEMPSGHLIAQPDPNDAAWKDHFYDFVSPEAMQIMVNAQQRCGVNVHPQICTP